MKPVCILIFLALAANAEVAADSGPMTGRAPANGLIASPPPFEIAWKKEGAVAGAGLLCAAAGFFAERSVHPLSSGDVALLSRNSVNPIDRSATWRYSRRADGASDILIAFVAAAPLGLLTNKKIGASWRTVSLMYLEVALLSYALPALGKGIAGRNRPYTYNPAVPLEEKLTKDARASFFSRHATIAFASSCFVSAVYGSYCPNSAPGPYLWAGGLLAAAAVGALRYECGAHFPTDIAVGALTGCAIGCGVPFLHKGAGGGRASQFSIRPQHGGIIVSYGMQ